MQRKARTRGRTCAHCHSVLPPKSRRWYCNDRCMVYANVDIEEGENPCWKWRLVKPNGYGCTSDHKSAHRFVWTVFVGEIPEGKILCHKCDVKCPVGDKSYKSCVNPAHIFIGTNKDNTQDMIAKGRRSEHGRRRKTPDTSAHVSRGTKIRNGSSHHNSILNEEMVRQIRSMSGTYKQIAAVFGVSHASVGDVIRRNTWRHVSDERVESGQNTTAATLTPEQVLEIFRSSEKREITAAKFGVTGAMVCHIKKGRAWCHVTGMPPYYSKPQRVSNLVPSPSGQTDASDDTNGDCDGAANTATGSATE